MLLNSHISACAICFAGKVCGPVQSIWGTSLGEDKFGARARILNTKVARQARAGQTFPLGASSSRAGDPEFHFPTQHQFGGGGSQTPPPPHHPPQPTPPAPDHLVQCASIITEATRNCCKCLHLTAKTSFAMRRWYLHSFCAASKQVSQARHFTTSHTQTGICLQPRPAVRFCNGQSLR